MSARPDAPSQRRQAPSPPEDAPGAEPATQPGRTHARPHQPTPESAHQSRGPHEEDAHSYEYRIRNSPATPRLRHRRRHQRSSTDNKSLPAHTPGPPSPFRREGRPPPSHSGLDVNTFSQGAAKDATDSRGGCNTCYALNSSSRRCLNVSQFIVLRGGR